VALTLDDKDFLLYCIAESYTAVELEHARNVYNQLQPEIDQDIEDLL
jgi:hypothetical protein